ncbi:MAG: hypothetical protein ACE5EA_02280 [Nitrospirota bacterium]
MKRLFIITFSIIFVLCIYSEHNLLADQSYRDNIVIPPNDIYKNLLKYIEREDYQKIKKALNLLNGIINVLDAKYSINLMTKLNNSIKRNDNEMILKLIYRLIYFDALDLMDNSIEAVEVSPDKAKTKLKMSYLNYILLSPIIEKKSFSSDIKIKRMFRDANRILDAFSPYTKSNSSGIDLHAFRNITRKIAQECDIVVSDIIK